MDALVDRLTFSCVIFVSFSEDRRTANVLAETPGVECLVVERT